MLKVGALLLLVTCGAAALFPSAIPMSDVEGLLVFALYTELDFDDSYYLWIAALSMNGLAFGLTSPH